MCHCYTLAMNPSGDYPATRNTAAKDAETNNTEADSTAYFFQSASLAARSLAGDRAQPASTTHPISRPAGPLPQSASSTEAARPYRDERKPKRPVSAYALFFRDQQKSLSSTTKAQIAENKKARQRVGEDGKKLDGRKLGGSAHLISERWKNITQDQRRYYEELAAQDKKRYFRQMEEWTAYMQTFLHEAIDVERGESEERKQSSAETKMQESQSSYDSVPSIGTLSRHVQQPPISAYRATQRQTSVLHLPQRQEEAPLNWMEPTRTFPSIEQSIPELAEKLGADGVDLVIRIFLGNDRRRLP